MFTVFETHHGHAFVSLPFASTSSPLPPSRPLRLSPPSAEVLGSTHRHVIVVVVAFVVIARDRDDDERVTS